MRQHRLPTDRGLLLRANTVSIQPAVDRAVFYHGAEGAQRATRFVLSHPDHTRLDELLQATAAGRDLFHHLRHAGKDRWERHEEVWWTLSVRLAEAAAGIVHCFGPILDLSPSGDAAPFESRFVGKRYMDTIFEKVEYPALAINPRVTTIYFNGVRF